MASVVWDVGRDIEDSYKNLFKIVNNSDSYSREELLKIIENQAKDFKKIYNNLSEEYGWG